MHLAPVLGDFTPRAQPYAVVLAHVLEKLDQAHGLGWPADQAVVQRHAHDLWTLGALLVEKVEAIDHILREFVRGAEAGVAVEPVVVGLQRIWDHQMMAVAEFHPERQFVAEIVTVVEEAAVLDQEPPRVYARTTVEPSCRRRAGQGPDPRDGEPDMLTLLVLRHPMVVEPAPAMADDFMPVGDKGRGQLWILLQRADDAEDADLH